MLQSHSSQNNLLARKEARYFNTNRPWLTLYGRHVRAIPPPGNDISKDVESSLINKMLPDELLHEIFVRMTPITLGKSACVCKRWKYSILSPSLWRNLCLQSWKTYGEEENENHAWEKYAGSWRTMFRLRPRLRTEGIYVSRNTYIRVGIMEWNTKNPVHIVCYFRYLRFLPSGKFYYKVSPSFVRDVAHSMKSKPSKFDNVLTGKYTLNDNLVEAAILYPGSRPTILRIRAKVRGTCQGANNRLDLLSLITCGIEEEDIPSDREDVLNAVEDWEEEESRNPHVPAVSHKRGMAPFVFVPFEEADTDILNLPIDKMDYYRPG